MSNVQKQRLPPHSRQMYRVVLLKYPDRLSAPVRVFHRQLAVVSGRHHTREENLFVLVGNQKPRLLYAGHEEVGDVVTTEDGLQD